MRNATKFLILASVGALAACSKEAKAPEQNLALEQAVPDNATLANADIEALPADESSGASANELEAGSDNPDVNELNANSD